MNKFLSVSLILLLVGGCGMFGGGANKRGNSGSSVTVEEASYVEGDLCQKTLTGGSTCGLGEYCDIENGHPYKCVAQPCIGDDNCPESETLQDGSVVGHQCVTSSYINACEEYVISGPTNITTCPTGQACTLTHGLGANSGVCANNTCTCTTPTQCASGYFCKIATKTCVAYTPNECTNTPNLVSDNCSTLYFSTNTFQFYCAPNQPTRCNRLIESSCSIPGCNACKKHRWCQTNWCHYSANADPTSEPPDPNNLTLVGSCRAKKNDGTLGLNVGEMCADASQCTGRTGLVCEGNPKKCYVNYGQSCTQSSECKSPGVCTHGLCYIAGMGLGGACTYEEQCSPSWMKCYNGVCSLRAKGDSCGTNGQCACGACDQTDHLCGIGYEHGICWQQEQCRDTTNHYCKLSPVQGTGYQECWGKKPNGYNCDHDYQCFSGHCHNGNHCQNP